jgi:hypothetical protein
LGVLLGTSPIVAATALGVFLVTFGVTSIVSLSSLAAAATLPVSGILLREPVAILWGYGAMLAYIAYRHLPNLRRLVKGEEPQFQFRRPEPPAEPGQSSSEKEIGLPDREDSPGDSVESMEPEERQGEVPEGSEHAVRRSQVGP